MRHLGRHESWCGTQRDVLLHSLSGLRSIRWLAPWASCASRGDWLGTERRGSVPTDGGTAAANCLAPAASNAAPIYIFPEPLIPTIPPALRYAGALCPPP